MSSGDAVSITIVDSARSGRACDPRPKHTAHAPIAPIVAARMMDGCMPTMCTNKKRVHKNAAITTERGILRLRNSTVAADAINDVCAPDTADRWLKPETFIAWSSRSEEHTSELQSRGH